MCDEVTEAENAAFAAGEHLSRRRFNALGAGAAAAAVLPGCASAKDSDKNAAGPATREREVAVKTADGSADGFFVHPAQGRHPAVLIWPDVAGLREAYRNIARRLAQSGFAVLAINHYYRSSPAPIVGKFEEWRTPAGQAKIGPMRAALTPVAILRDATALVGWLDAQPQVDTARAIGSSGYCMTGSYTIRAAAAVPSRVKAAASFHGGGLVDATPDSPHLLIPKAKAAFYFGVADNDDKQQPESKDILKKTLAEAKRPGVVTVYTGAQHGWCMTDFPVYNAPSAEIAWANMLATYKQTIA